MPLGRINFQTRAEKIICDIISPMPKNIDDMIVPERKRSIRDIPIPLGRRKSSEQATSPLYKEPTPPTLPPLRNSLDFLNDDKPSMISESPRPRRKGVWIASGVGLVVLIFALLSLFNGATLSYVPKSAIVSFDNDIYTANKTGDGKLLYSVVKLSNSKGQDVPATGEESVSRKSSGTIIVYNDATTEAQKLIATTRFETPSGLVYRTPNDIVVPGKKVVSGVSQPGIIEVVVYADEAGDKYNVGLSDFTLPGLKGSARFSTIYARSKTVMSGGFIGMEKSVSDADKARTKNELETALRNELLSEVKAQVPADFVLLPALSLVTFEDLPQTESTSEGSVVINVRADLHGVMFKRTDLTTHLVVNKTTLAQGDLVDILELDSLNIDFVDTRPTDLLLSDEIKFSVSGSATLVWRTDEVALRADIVGRRKSEINSILNNYPTITSATATIRPFWKGSFPSGSERITIKKLSVE